MFTAGADVAAALLLPARSVTDRVSLSATPSFEMTVSEHSAARKPAPAPSSHVQSTTTSSLNQPAAFGLPTGAPLNAGTAVSMLTTTVAELPLSAKSTADPTTA